MSFSSAMLCISWSWYGKLDCCEQGGRMLYPWHKDEWYRFCVVVVLNEMNCFWNVALTFLYHLLQIFRATAAIIKYEKFFVVIQRGRVTNEFIFRGVVGSEYGTLCTCLIVTFTGVEMFIMKYFFMWLSSNRQITATNQHEIKFYTTDTIQSSLIPRSRVSSF
jgi:hypothetical protein